MLATGIRGLVMVGLVTPDGHVVGASARSGSGRHSLLGGQDLFERPNTQRPEDVVRVGVAHETRAGVARSSSLEYPRGPTSRTL